jgi:hypothetical protein
MDKSAEAGFLGNQAKTCSNSDKWNETDAHSNLAA